MPYWRSRPRAAALRNRVPDLAPVRAGASSTRRSPVNEYFVVWENLVDFDPSTIRAKRLHPDSGSEIGPSFEVVGDATYQRRKPAVAWNADAGRYLVTYERYEGTAQEDVYAASVSYNGTVFSPDLGIAGYAPEENQIDVAACNGSWMVVWKGGNDANG